MTEPHALAANDELLREIAGMATAEDSPEIKSLPVLKINYDGDSVHPQGSWVVGQKKKDDAIIEQGAAVKGLVILAVRNRYSLYVEADTSKNCNSPLHLQGDSVRGSNYKHVCGRGCPNRAEGIDPRCQAQKVVYGLALTSDDKLVECVGYFKGSGYMPLANYVEKMTSVRAGSRYVTVPPFTFMTLLDSEKKKNGSVTYWVPIFSQGTNFSIEQIRQFDEKRKQVYAFIDLCSLHNLTPSNVSAHSQFPNVTKTCPGKLFPWEDFKALLRERWRKRRHGFIKGKNQGAGA